MTTRDLLLDIALNLGRIGRFLLENRPTRAHQFSSETSSQLKSLKPHKLPKSLNFPISQSQKLISKLTTNNIQPTTEDIEDIFTSATILTHRANLA